MSLFSKRVRQREEDEARARGENVDYLVEDVPKEFRQQLVFAIDTAVTWPDGFDSDSAEIRRYLIAKIYRYLLEEFGRPSLADGKDVWNDLGRFIFAASTHEVMDVIDAVIVVLFGDFAEGKRRYARGAQSSFIKTIRRRLGEHKLAYDIVSMEVVQKKSEELHRSVVVGPVLV